MNQKTTVLELAKKALVAELERAYATKENAHPFGDGGQERDKALKQYEETYDYLLEMMTPGKPKRLPLSMKEATYADDYLVLFPKVVQEVLARPQEPLYIGQTLLSRTIQVDGAKLISFPTFSGFRAFEVAENGTFPEQDIAITNNSTEIRTRKYGLKVAIAEEVIEESQWDIYAMYIEAMGSALRRLKEEKIFNEYDARAFVAFDNSDNAKLTTGKDADGTTNNGTFSQMDLIDMMAVMIQNGHNPTDLILHPLGWAIWAKDPFLRFQLLNSSSIGQSVGLPSMDAGGIQGYVPFGLNVVVSPFQSHTLDTNINGLGTANYTTITLVDRNSSIIILQDKPMAFDQWENVERDMKMTKISEKYGLAITDGGRSAVVAKNVKIGINHEPLYNVGNVTVA